jgi:hypothetical protein
MQARGLRVVTPEVNVGVSWPKVPVYSLQNIHRAVTRSSGKPTRPADAAVAEALGPAKRLWDDIRRRVGREFAPMTEEWAFSGKKHGWTLRLGQKKRAVLYLKPLEGCFRVSLALGPKAVDAARAAQHPPDVLRRHDEAVQYPEGKAIRIEVHNAKDIRVAMQLATMRMEA